MLVHYWFVLETLLVKITGRHGQVLFIYDFIITNKTIHSFLKVSFSDLFKIYSSAFIICALILPISARFDYRSNSAIMTPRCHKKWKVSVSEFFWSAFSLLRIQNREQKNSEYGHFSCCDNHSCQWHLLLVITRFLYCFSSAVRL